jgi:hypothetical protein
MHYRLVALLILIGLSIEAEPCHAQQPGSLEWYQAVTKDVLKNARALIRPALNKREAEIERSIKFRVSADPAFVAEAGQEDDQRVVVISAGAIQAIDFVSDAIIFEELGGTGCVSDYIQYWSAAVIDNSERYGQGLAPKRVASPAIFARSGGNACSNTDLSGYASEAEYKSKMIEASIMYLYLHELGHHVLHHIGSEQPVDADDKNAFRREQEDAADRYAFETAPRANYSLLAAVPMMVIISGIGGNSIEAEHKSDHPLGLKRYLRLIQLSIDRYEQDPSAIPDGADDIVMKLKNFKASLDEQISHLK